MSRRAYLRFDPQFFERKVIEDRYPFGAVTALVSTFCLAEEQPDRGRFRSEKLLRLLLDGPDRPTKLSRWVSYLIEHGDLIRQGKGVLYVEGWDEWQEGDWKVAERVSRIRSRTKVTPPVTVDVTPKVTPPDVSTLQGGGGSGGYGISGGGGVARPRDNGGGSKILGERNRQPNDEERLVDLRRRLLTTTDPDLRMGIEATIERLEGRHASA